MTSSDDDARKVLSDVGEEILTALTAVVRAAHQALSHAPGGMSRTALVNPSNTMVGDCAPEKFSRAKYTEDRQNLRRLLLEPFVARVEVDWGPSARRSVQTLYFPRRSAVGMLDAIRGANFVTSGAALGRLAEYEAGETAYIEVPGGEREGRILKRTVLTPAQQDGVWDALIGIFETMPWGDVLDLLRHESLRRALEEIKREQAGPLAVEDILGHILKEAADAALERHRIRRKVVDRIALRDQPILDKFQGAIFRLPLVARVIRTEGTVASA
jgi:hypothetical protein